MRAARVRVIAYMKPADNPNPAHAATPPAAGAPGASVFFNGACPLLSRDCPLTARGSRRRALFRRCLGGGCANARGPGPVAGPGAYPYQCRRWASSIRRGGLCRGVRAAAGQDLARTNTRLTDPAGQHVRIDADFQGNLPAAGLRLPNQFDALLFALRAVTLALRHRHTFGSVGVIAKRSADSG
jgi:hypothetical protein